MDDFKFDYALKLDLVLHGVLLNLSKHFKLK